MSKRLEQISAREYSVGGGDRDAVGKDPGVTVGKSKPNSITAEARSAEHEPDRARESFQAPLRCRARAKEPSAQEAVQLNVRERASGSELNDRSQYFN